ncbi:hypothetical protein [Paenibacillus sonchi]|uniref:hypothetical protein n=1 Tax=Paenibacillus sonchi TaxID=373687 RepID=UPI00398B897D
MGVKKTLMLCISCMLVIVMAGCGSNNANSGGIALLHPETAPPRLRLPPQRRTLQKS